MSDMDKTEDIFDQIMNWSILRTFRPFYKKYKGLILYGIFGVMTTIVNLSIYYICVRIAGIQVVISSIIAWIVSVSFAYITNRIFVFQSNKTERNDILKELFSFVTARILSEILELVILTVFVTWLGQNDMTWKVISSVLIIIANYIASKFVVFKK